MKLFLYVIGFLLTILIINVKTYKSREVVIGWPYYFGYRWGDTLNMKIILKNIPVGVTGYVVTLPEGYKTQRILINTYKKEDIITIGTVFMFNTLIIDIELWSKSPMLCYKNNIVQAGDVIGHLFEYDSTCLQASRPCVIEIDLKNECQGIYQETPKPPPATFMCSKESLQFICTSKYQDYTIHQWYQGYSYESSIGNIPPMRAILTKLILELEIFDNDTVVFVNLKSTMTMNSNIMSNKGGSITLLANESSKYYYITTLRYSDLKEVYFNCREYLNRTNYTQVGLINLANKMTTYNTTDVIKNFNKADNGSVLCCIYYIIFNGSTEKHIHRFVSNKTLLLYEEMESSSLKPTGSKTASSVEYTVFYIVVPVIGIIILILVIFISFKSFHHGNSNPEVTLELNTYSNASRVLYADLDLPRGDQRPSSNEQSLYAEIIGVLKPRDGDANK